MSLGIKQNLDFNSTATPSTLPSISYDLKWEECSVILNPSNIRDWEEIKILTYNRHSIGYWWKNLSIGQLLLNREDLATNSPTWEMLCPPQSCPDFLAGKWASLCVTSVVGRRDSLRLRERRPCMQWASDWRTDGRTDADIRGLRQEFWQSVTFHSPACPRGRAVFHNLRTPCVGLTCSLFYGQHLEIIILAYFPLQGFTKLRIVFSEVFHEIVNVSANHKQ